MDKLKPCPFCGFKIILLYNDHKVLCGNCSAQIKRSSEKKAIEAWNRRADAKPAEIDFDYEAED